MTQWLQVDDVTYSYHGKRVFSNLKIHASEECPILVVIGKSGVGKTTLVKLLAGHFNPHKGNINVCEDAVTGPSVARPVVFQDHNLFPWMTVQDNISFGLRCLKLNETESKQRVDRWVEKLQLSGTESLFPAMLSGGMKQRVGLARAMAVNPKCVIMDEPFSALDYSLREALCLIISELAQRGTKFVVVTHDLSDAVYLGTVVCAVLAEDQVVTYDIKEPAHPRPVSFRRAPRFHEYVASVKEMLDEKP
jgi:NitT/TauT family transport system ATP-binding protein